MELIRKQFQMAMANPQEADFQELEQLHSEHLQQLEPTFQNLTGLTLNNTIGKAEFQELEKLGTPFSK